MPGAGRFCRDRAVREATRGRRFPCRCRGAPATPGSSGVLLVSALPRSADAGPGVRALALGGSPRLPPGMARCAGRPGEPGRARPGSHLSGGCTQAQASHCPRPGRAAPVPDGRRLPPPAVRAAGSVQTRRAPTRTAVKPRPPGPRPGWSHHGGLRTARGVAPCLPRRTPRPVRPAVAAPPGPPRSARPLRPRNHRPRPRSASRREGRSPHPAGALDSSTPCSCSGRVAAVQWDDLAVHDCSFDGIGPTRIASSGGPRSPVPTLTTGACGFPAVACTAIPGSFTPARSPPAAGTVSQRTHRVWLASFETIPGDTDLPGQCRRKTASRDAWV
jgi:hypothetical protein